MVIAVRCGVCGSACKLSFSLLFFFRVFRLIFPLQQNGKKHIVCHNLNSSSTHYCFLCFACSKRKKRQVTFKRIYNNIFPTICNHLLCVVNQLLLSKRVFVLFFYYGLLFDVLRICLFRLQTMIPE